MKFLLTTIFTLGICISMCKAQQIGEPKFNAISFELGKTGLIYNLTFDHRMKKENLGFRFNAGSNFAKYLNAISLGVGSYYLIGRSAQFLELGVDLQYLIINKESDDQRGFSFVYPDHAVSTLLPSANIGYRTTGKHTLFRVGISPGLVENKIFPGGYIGVGVLF